MTSWRKPLAIVATLAALFGAATLVVGRGVPGQRRAPELAREALQRLGFAPLGSARVTLESDPLLAWALDRSEPGFGRSLAWGEGGAVRWKVVFGGGGEAVVTPDGSIWSVRRPVPSAPGTSLFPVLAQPQIEAGLARFVAVPDAWRPVRRQSWREADRTWYRGRFAAGSGLLPDGWRREAEVEIVGSTVISFKRRVHPLGTHVGVVVGRVRELAVLRVPAFAACALVLVAVLVGGLESWAFYRATRPFLGGAAFVTVAGVALAAGQPLYVAVALAVTGGAVAASHPLWRRRGVRVRWVGAVVGIVIAGLAIRAPELVSALGGWMPALAPVSTALVPVPFVAAALLPALVEEPLLRGALPGLVSNSVGWWGGAIAGAGIGALLHTTPSVPLVATVAVAFAVQLAFALTARWSGIGAAILARAAFEAVVRRPAFAAGPVFDTAALVLVAVALMVALLEALRR